jgi:hypothetical protein
MINASVFAIASLGIVLSVSPVSGQTHADYREFLLGSPVARVLEQVHSTVADVVLLHERPALLQELQWRAPYLAFSLSQVPKDPVQQIVFSFFDDQLFRITVDYSRLQTEGMTDADMVASFSKRYGTPLVSPDPAKAPVTLSAVSLNSSTDVARWSDGDMTVVLSRNRFTSLFQVVVRSERLNGLARVADDEAVRAEAAAAPALDLARRQLAADDARAAKEKARASNIAAFLP